MTPTTSQFVLDDLRLQRNASEPLQEQILVFLRRGIRDGRLQPGSRMPSSRTLASAHGISRTTVVEVYSRLEAEGYVIARPRAGYFVTTHLSQQPFIASDPDHTEDDVRAERPPEQYDGTPPRWNDWHPTSDSDSGECEHQPLVPGVPAVDRFPWRQWTRLSGQVLRRHTVRAFSWADPRGELPFREAVAEYLAAFRGPITGRCRGRTRRPGGAPGRRACRPTDLCLLHGK